MGHLLTIGLGVYMGGAVASYLVLLLLSIFADHQYKRGQGNRDLILWGVNHDKPGVTIIAPAKNEEPIIKPSVAALLHVPYPNLQVIVVDDGSTDRTFDILKQVYQLEEMAIPAPKLPHKPIESAWYSKNEPRLRVLRKQSVGSKGDGNNAALEIVNTPYVLCTDVDSTIEPDTLQKMVARSIETGAAGVACNLRPLNGCTVTDKGVRLALPRNYWAFSQVLEYLRTFQFRQGWAALGSVFNISGAAGLFKTEALFTIGGYRSDTTAEDLASTWSLHHFGMKVAHEPSANIYTQVPDSNKALGSQRRRWARGLFQNLLFPNARHIMVSGKRQMFMLLWLWAYEVVEPFIEIVGIYWIVYKAVTHTMPQMGWYYLLAALALCPLLSIISVSQMERCYRRLSTRDRFLLYAFSFVELFPLKLPVGLAWRIEGAIKFLTGDTSWEALPRQQFKEEKSCAI